MKGVDYRKALSKEREYFQDTIKKTQDSANKRIADSNERTEGIVEKQRNTFIEDKAELESNYKGNLEKLNDKTRASLEDNNEVFSEGREKEREAFTQESMTKKKDFDQRLNDITSSFKKSSESERDSNQDLQETMKKKYDTNIANTRSHSDKQLGNYRDKMSATGEELKDQYKRERQQLVRSQEDNTNSIHKENAAKRVESQDRLRADLKKSKEVQSGDAEQQKEYANDRLKTIEKKLEDRNQKVVKEYSERSDKMVEAQQRESKASNRENQNKLMEAQRGFNKQVRMIDLEKRRRDNSSGEFSEITDRQQGLRDATANDNRYKVLKDQMAVKQGIYHEKAASDQEAFNETLRIENSEGTARLDRKLTEASADKIITVSKEREKAETQMAN